MAGDESFKRVQSAYERLRRKQPHLSHKELWQQAQQAVMSETDPPGEVLSVQDRKDRMAARTEELVVAEGLKWNEAWRQAETEFGVIPVTGSGVDERLLLLLVGGFASVWLGFLGAYAIRGGENPAEPLYLLVVNGDPDEFLAGLSAATALPAVLLFAVGFLLGASSKTQRPRVAACGDVAAGIPGVHIGFDMQGRAAGFDLIGPILLDGLSHARIKSPDPTNQIIAPPWR